MKKLIVFVVLALIAVVSIGRYSARAQGIGPYMALTAVTTGTSCPTPAFSGTQAQGVLCTDGTALYFSSPTSPAPQKVFLGTPPAGGLTATGTIVSGHLAVFASPTSLMDGGAVPVVPAGVVTSPVTIPNGHLAIAGSGTNTLVDGGAPPTLPRFSSLVGGIHCPGFSVVAGTLDCPAGASIQ